MVPVVVHLRCMQSQTGRSTWAAADSGWVQRTRVMLLRWDQAGKVHGAPQSLRMHATRGAHVVVRHYRRPKTEDVHNC